LLKQDEAQIPQLQTFDFKPAVALSDGAFFCVPESKDRYCSMIFRSDYSQKAATDGPKTSPVSEIGSARFCRK
jgi:hypothetical protein